MAPDPNKIQAVKECPVPSNIAGVQHFLGTALYYLLFQRTVFLHTIAILLHAVTQKTMYNILLD